MQTSPERENSPAKYKNSTPQSKLLKLDRKFNVPLTKLFAAFTTAQALKAWWWPKGVFSNRIEFDFRQGGKYFINMKGLEGNGVGGGGMTGKFEEITPNVRIVMSDQFADEKGRPISAKEAKAPGVWPETVYITFDFELLDESTSRVTLSQQGIPNEAQKDCLQGWSEMFDKLAKHLGDAKTS